jgi:hypothetical protein
MIEFPFLIRYCLGGKCLLTIPLELILADLIMNSSTKVYTSRESSYQVDNLESVYLNAPGETDGPGDGSS